MKHNPYIGPRPYGRGEGNFFGREREGKELAWLIMAEQSVLFYAQSGAGKTSLLNARVIPILEQKGVQVLPVARVGSALPEGIAPEQVDNIFTFSALLSLSADHDLPPESLLTHTLLSYLQEYGLPLTTNSQSPITQSPNHQSPTLLIFDQFEEIATTHREHWEQAEGFFRQVREAIDNLPGLGVLFVLREDYVAELDPYTPLLPSHLQARFRMTLPTRAQAMEIVQGPASTVKCPFTDDAAENLVKNLSRIKDTRATENCGQYVEPVQLQVVCQQLWESLPESVSDDKFITWDEIKHYNVDDALTTFYESTLKTCQVSENLTGLVTERRLRRWFSEALITPEGRRGLALQGATETAGLPNAVVAALENHHLIRAETRGGSRWYELSHDRLVEPIVQSNRGWEQAQENLHPWRPVARQWEKAPSETLLYRGKELATAQAWLAVAVPGEVEGYERAFIKASEEAERGRKRKRRLYIVGGITAVVLILVMSGLTAWAYRNQREAEQQAQIALVRQLGAQATNILDQDPELALLLSVETWQRTLQNKQSLPLGSEVTLRQAMTDYHLRHKFPMHNNIINSQIFSPDGTQLGTLSASYNTADSKDFIEVWNTLTGQRIAGFPRAGAANLLAFNQDNNLLAVSMKSIEGGPLVTPTMQVLDILSGTQIAQFESDFEFCQALFGLDKKRLFSLHGECFNYYGMLWRGYKQINIWNVETQQSEWKRDVLNAALDADGSHIALILPDGIVQVWDTLTLQPVFTDNLPLLNLVIHTAPYVALSADGRVVAVMDDESVYWWDITGETFLSLPANSATSIKVSGDGRKLALMYEDSYNVTQSRVELYNTKGELLDRTYFDAVTQGLGVYDIALNRDVTKLAVSSRFGTMRVWLWDFDQARMTAELRGHKDNIFELTFDPQGSTLATGSADGVVHLWDTSGATGQHWKSLSGRRGGVRQIAFSPIDIPLLAVVSQQDTVSLWNLATGTQRTMPGRQIAFHPQGDILGVNTLDESILLQSVQTGSPLVVTNEQYSLTIDSLAFSLDDTLLFSASNTDHTFRSWDSDTLALINTILFRGVIVDHSERYLLTNEEGRRYLWDAFTGEILSFDCPVEVFVEDNSFNPQNSLFIGRAPEGDYTIPVCSIKTGSLIQRLDIAGGDLVLNSAFSGNNQRLAALTWEGAGAASVGIEVWDLATWDKIAYFDARSTVGEPEMQGFGLSNDGTRIVTGFRKVGTLEIWDTILGEMVGTLSSQSSKVNIVQFSPTCITLPIGDAFRCVELIATAGSSPTVLVDLINPEDLVALACTRLNRNLTRAEWQQYLGDEPYRATCPNLPEADNELKNE